MPENFSDIIIPLSIFAAVVGALLFIQPSIHYQRSSSIGWAGLAFMLLGTVLLTNFKWESVVLEIQGSKLEIAKLQEELEVLDTELSTTQLALASAKALADKYKMLEHGTFAMWPGAPEGGLAALGD